MVMKIHRTSLALSALALFVMATWGCEKKTEEQVTQKEVLLLVRTVDLQGQPVELVRFYINNKKFGITDQDGYFKGKYPANDGDTLTFNVETPEGYSIPPNVDQSRWLMTVNFPENRPLQVEFVATLQRPKRDYLFMVRSTEPGTSVNVNGELVGKTGPGGDALLLVSGAPGEKLEARVGSFSYKGRFADDDEVYLVTPDKVGPVGEATAAVAVAVPAAEPEPDPGAEKPAPADKPVSASAAAARPKATADENPWGAFDTPSRPARTPREVRAKPESEPDPTPIREETAGRIAIAEPASEWEAEPEAEPEPVALAIPEPIAAVEAEPIADLFADEVEPEPVPIPEPEPEIFESPEPELVAAEPLPVAIPDSIDFPESEPVAMPEPVAIPEPELEAFAEPELVAIPEPEPEAFPEPVAMPEPERAATPKSVIAIPSAADSTAVAKRAESELGDDLLEDDGVTVRPDSIRASTAASGGDGPSPATMSREEITAKLGDINQRLESSQVLSRGDVDFLGQIDRTHPAYFEAHRVLANYHHNLKDYKKQASELEIATRGGRYKRDPQILLSLAKSYARQKRYQKSLSTMRRVESNMRRLTPEQKADTYKFHAEVYEFEFLRQYHEDAKKANVTLLDKAISKLDRYVTFNRGANPGAVGQAEAKIRKLTELKGRLEL